MKRLDDDDSFHEVQVRFKASYTLGENGLSRRDAIIDFLRNLGGVEIIRAGGFDKDGNLTEFMREPVYYCDGKKISEKELRKLEKEGEKT